MNMKHLSFGNQECLAWLRQVKHGQPRAVRVLGHYDILREKQKHRIKTPTDFPGQDGVLSKGEVGMTVPEDWSVYSEESLREKGCIE